MRRFAALVTLTGLYSSVRSRRPAPGRRARRADRRVSCRSPTRCCKSRPGRLADVAAHARQLGLQPADIRSTAATSRSSRMVWTRGRSAPGHPGRHAAGPRRRDVLPEPAATSSRRSTRRRGDLLWEYRRKLPEDLGKYIPVPASTATSRSAAHRSSTPAPTTIVYALDARDRQAGVGNARSSTTTHARAADAPARSSPTAKSSPAAAASPKAAPTPASSPRTTRRPARSCGARARFPSPASRATRPGATCRWSSAGTSAPGWCRATTRS